ncbi:MAG TPA: ABC transporter permease [Blastocatellia bacterium]|nr:ABC transporter permease [Blastocatellia bacterium]
MKDFLKPHLWLIRFIGVIVPRRFRDRFRQEWKAELDYREELLARWDRLDWRNKLELLWRSLGAFWDALWLQRQRWEDEMIQDLRYGLRMLLQNPGFTLVAVITLSLGIGANTAIFSVVNAVMLRPLPYDDPGRLVMLWTDDPKHDVRESGTSYVNFTDWRNQSQVFAEIAIFRNEPVILTSEDETERVVGGFASANLFPLLGVKPMLGRFYSPDEEERGEGVVILSYVYWRRRFGGDPNAIGKTLETINVKGIRSSARVIGVMPAEFYFQSKETLLWTPATAYWRWQREKTERYLDTWRVVGRLKPQTTLRQAQAEMSAIGQRLAQTYPTTDPYFPGFAVNVVPLLDQVTGKNLQLALLVLMGAVVFVLLIACVNVANLLLSRGAARSREFAIRAALGAGRARLLRQLLTESSMLALGAGLFGFGLAAAGIRTLASYAPPGISRLDEVRLDMNVLLFTFGISLLAGLLFGLAPALKISRGRPGEALKEDSGGSSGGLRLRQTRGLLVIVECALAVTLLTGAGLLIRSFLRLQAVNPGFKPEGALLVRVAPPLSKRGVGAEAFFQELRERIAATPGVQAVEAIGDFLLRRNPDESITIPGRPPMSEGAASQLASENVSPGFFQTIGTPLLRGRFLSRADALAKTRIVFTQPLQGLSHSEQASRAQAEAVIINETFARRFFPGEDPIGKRFSEGPPNRLYWYEIVGVVGDMRRQGLERRPVPEFFGSHTGGATDLVARAGSDPLALAVAIREAIRSVDKNTMIHSVTTVEARMGELGAQRRLNTWLLAMFAALAFLLALIGIYGVMRYSVAQRTREIGIRIALGARRADVFRLVIGQGMKLTLIGVAAGLLAALWLTSVMSHLLFEVSVHDPATFAGVALALVIAALLACYLPARKASKVDPLVALRYE